MSPCLKHGDKIKTSPPTHIKRNDLVIFKRKNKLIIKRVVALNGDSLKLIKNKSCFNIIINEKVQKSLSGKDYCSGRKVLLNFETKSLNKQYLIVLGETLSGSEDSTLYGPIERDAVVAVGNCL